MNEDIALSGLRPTRDRRYISGYARPYSDRTAAQGPGLRASTKTAVVLQCEWRDPDYHLTKMSWVPLMGTCRGRGTYCTE